MREGRYLVQGVDVWLNNPRRPLEASGTSGMKAAMNGVVNCSVLDGWWDEGWNGTNGGNGWAIGGRETNPDEGAQDWHGRAGPVPDHGAGDRASLVRPRSRTACPGSWLATMREAIKTLHVAVLHDAHARGVRGAALPACRPGRTHKSGSRATEPRPDPHRPEPAPPIVSAGCLASGRERSPSTGTSTSRRARIRSRVGRCPTPPRPRQPDWNQPHRGRVLCAQRGHRATSGASGGTWAPRSPAGCGGSSRRSTTRSWARMTAHNGMAQSYHHAILPYASARDRRTEIRWGMRDFELRVGRRPSGMWLPETAIDRLTLRVMRRGRRSTGRSSRHGRRTGPVDHRHRVRGRTSDGEPAASCMGFYDAELSAAVSFDPFATTDADRFLEMLVRPRLGAGETMMIATDGELYGHHQKFRELFLQRLLTVRCGGPGHRPSRVPGGWLGNGTGPGHPAARARSVSGRHGRAITAWLRWGAECPCAPGMPSGSRPCAPRSTAWPPAIDVRTELAAVGAGRGSVGGA